MPMQFGLFMMPLHPPERSFTESYDRDLVQIVLADRLGYHAVWIGEHLTERWGNAPAPIHLKDHWRMVEAGAASARCWGEITCGISCPTAMAPVKWQRRKLTRVCLTRLSTWTL